MICDRTWQVEPDRAGQRLDAFLSNSIPTTSRSLAIQAIESDKILVNGRAGKKGQKLEARDEVRVIELMETSDWKARPNPDVRVPVLHEDVRFLILNKPAGLPVHPLDPRETNTVVNGLLAAYPELAAVGPDPLFPAIVHRLDAETSGVMLAARDQKTYDYFRRQFREKRVAKQYTALACGILRENARLDHWLVHSSSDQHRMLIVDKDRTRQDQKAMIAVTEFTVLRNLPRHTLLDVTIKTGVTHQIRCQLAHMGHPLAGDSLYGSKEADAEYEGRLFLHAAEIRFPDPVTGTERKFTAALPEDLERPLKELKP